MGKSKNFIIENGVLKEYIGNDTEVIIPDGVTVIGSCVFQECKKLEKVIIPESVTEIGDYAFGRCGITEIAIPGNVKKIGVSAFESCKKLKNISIPSSVISIGEDAFEGTEFLSENGVWENDALYLNDYLLSVNPKCKYLNIRPSTKIIAGGLYDYYDKPEFTELTIPDGVIGISEKAFSNCNQLKHIFISESVKHIGYDAFGKQSLESIVVDSKNKCYDSRNNCNAIIDSRTNELILGCRCTHIPEGVTKIGDYAFAKCFLPSNLVLPEGLEIIGNNAFMHCDTIKNIVIPKSVSEIGNFAFNGCDKIEDITIEGDNVRIGIRAFSGCGSLRNFEVKGQLKNELSHYDFEFSHPKKFSLTDKTYSAGIKIDAKFAECLNPTEFQLACLIIYQNGKKWQDFFDKSVNEGNSYIVISHCIDLLRQTEKVSSKLAETVSQIAIRFYNSVGIAALKELSEVLSEKKKESADLVRTIYSLENGENLDELAQKYTVVQTKVIDIEKAEIIVSGSKISKLPFGNIVDAFADKIAEKREQSGYLKLKNISFLGLKSKNTEMYFGNGCLQEINLILNIDCFSKLLRKLESEIDKKYEGRKDTIYYESEKMIIAGSPVDDDIELRIMFL